MERKRTISEDAILKTQHLLIIIHGKIKNLEFPFSIYKLAESEHISNTTVRAMFNLQLFKRTGGSQSGRYEWLHEGDINRVLAVQVMNRALELKEGAKSDTPKAITQQSVQSTDERLKFFRGQQKAVKEQTLFSGEDEKRNHAIQLAAGIAASAFNTLDDDVSTYSMETVLKTGYGVNTVIAELTEDLLTKIYKIKF